MSLKSVLINAMYLMGTAAGYRGYKSNLKNTAKKQYRKLKSLIEKNKNTCFGREHHFDKIHDVESFREYVPIREYEDFLPYIERIAGGEHGVLTAEDVILLEPTGGTTSGSKLIPYTGALKKEFQKAVNPWLFYLYKTYPQLLKGKGYWSITPAIADKKFTRGGIPVGFQEDSEYLGLLGRILRHVLIVPKEIRRMKDIENFRYATAYFLLMERDLVLISVWNPTFLILILETMAGYPDRLIDDIRRGTLTLPKPEPADFLRPYPRPDPLRADEIADIILREDSKKYVEIWKRLRLISCWTSGFSQYYAKRLAEYFPGVVIQGKGLIATEGIVSIPFFDGRGYFPAYTSHFFEFLEKENGEDHAAGSKNRERGVKLLHQLEVGKEYTVIITTGGGLYRYNLKDRVVVTGKYLDLPLIRFEGRENVCDIVGEKLSCGQVRRVVEEALRSCNINVDFIMLAPELEPSGCHYTVFMEIPHGDCSPDPETDENKQKLLRGVQGGGFLEKSPPDRRRQNVFIEGRDKVNDSTLRLFINKIEQGLAENYHYRYARDLGQITPLKLFLIDSGGIQTYFKRGIAEGQKAGDIKSDILDKRTGWEAYFKGVTR
jgi:hypothetical protein